jgi:hypothetical protein
LAKLLQELLAMLYQRRFEFSLRLNTGQGG